MTVGVGDRLGVVVGIGDGLGLGLGTYLVMELWFWVCISRGKFRVLELDYRTLCDHSYKPGKELSLDQDHKGRLGQKLVLGV